MLDERAVGGKLVLFEVLSGVVFEFESDDK
jgi:hypothetical protein